ncbi:hypothetical protein EON67_11635 [archaeon]|nr:MAG: hypothetical protein EON67_11635 [archaeon]
MFKRAVYLPKSPPDVEELASTTLHDSPHYLAFCDARYFFLHCYYRFEPSTVAKLASILLHAYRGEFRAKRDTLEWLRCVAARASLCVFPRVTRARRSRDSTCARVRATRIPLQ